MFFTFYKCISFSLTCSRFFFKKSNFNVLKFSKILDLKKQVKSKNKTNFMSLASSIQDYLKLHSNSDSPHFTEQQLWYVSNFINSFSTVSFLLSHDEQAFHIFEDISDLLRIARHKGSYKTMLILFDNVSRATLFNLFDSLSILKIANSDSSSLVLQLFLDSDKWKTISSRLDFSDIIKIAKSEGSRNIFNFVLDDSLWSKILDRFKYKGFLKIACHEGSRSVFNIALDDNNWHLICSRVGEDAFYKIVNRLGGRKSLLFILDNDKWSSISHLISNELLVKICSNEGSSKVLDIILNPKKFDLILSRIGEYSFEKAISYPTASLLFDYILCNKKWNKLLKNSDTEMIHRVSQVSGAHKIFEIISDSQLKSSIFSVISIDQFYKIINSGRGKAVLDFILCKEKCDAVISRIGFDYFIMIAVRSGAVNVFDKFLDDKQWQSLLDIIGFETIQKISRNSGSIHVFDIVLDPLKWNKLKSRLEDDELAVIISKDGARFSLEFILDDNRWNALKKELGIKNLVKLCSYNGSKQVIELFLNKSLFDKLLSRIGVESLVTLFSSDWSRTRFDYILDDVIWNKLSTRLGCKVVLYLFKQSRFKRFFPFVIDNSKWFKLMSRLGKKCIFRLCYMNQVSLVFNYILDNDKYELLKSRLGEQSLIFVASHHHAIYIFDSVLEKLSWTKILDRVGQNLFSQCAYLNQAKSTLDLCLDDSKWSLLLDRLSKKQILDILKNSFQRILSYIIDDKKWELFNKIFHKNTEITSTFRTLSIFSIENLINDYHILSSYFTSDSLFKYATLPVCHQKGLTQDNLKLLSSTYQFTEDEILSLAKLSGRHLSHILVLFKIRQFTMRLLFSGSWIGDLSSFHHNVNFSLKPHESKILITRIVELHQYCSSVPLSISDLEFLKKIPFTGSVSTHWSKLLSVLRVIGVFNSQSRCFLLKALVKRNWFESDEWLSRLYSLPESVRYWFITEGFELSENFFTKPSFPVHSNSSISTIFNLMVCFQYKSFRNFFSDVYFTQLSQCSQKHAWLVFNKISDDACHISPVFPHSLNPIDWLYICIKVYDSISYELSAFDRLEFAYFNLPDSLFSFQEIFKFKQAYPSIGFNSDFVLANLSISVLDRILYSDKVMDTPFSISSQNHLSRKRLLDSDENAKPLKKVKVSSTDFDGLDSLSNPPLFDDCSTDFSSFLNDMDWHQILTTEDYPPDLLFEDEDVADHLIL